MRLTIAQKLAWRRFGYDLLKVCLPVVVAVLSNPQALQELGIPARVITLVGLVVIPTITGLVKLRKENRKGLNYPD
ncbi:MAG: hypothetical protein ACYC7E_23310 [Armatimonadota bacterium]